MKKLTTKEVQSIFESIDDGNINLISKDSLALINTQNFYDFISKNYYSSSMNKSLINFYFNIKDCLSLESINHLIKSNIKNVYFLDDILKKLIDHNINLFQEDNKGNPILNYFTQILAIDHIGHNKLFFKALGSDNIKKAFLNDKSYPLIIKAMNYLNDGMLDEYFSSPEILNSGKYEELFNSHNDFIYHQCSVKNNSNSFKTNIIDSNPKFFARFKKEIISYVAFKEAFFYKDIVKIYSIDQLIENNEFLLNPLIVSEKMTTILNYHSLYFNSNDINTLKKLIDNNLIPDNIYYNKFSSTFIDNFVEHITSRNYYNQSLTKKDLLTNISNHLLLLKDIPNQSISEDNKDSITNLLQQFDSIDFNDTYEIAMRLHIPPPIIRELIKFFDARYGYVEKENSLSKNEINSIKNSILEFINNLPVDHKKSLSPN